ncbi:PREDICTED: RING-H2 finger protein ATL60-like [Camelina sativa]|uniref:RING-type E3 ubiquitin transferase n=1 Tax=Camelina sativa TaxID=90675 RepID=A0ABM0VWY9_CAMSA|nr:PREDICTED: RING-H2 finger protein ATL60-like [Camelina sativa]
MDEESSSSVFRKFEGEETMGKVLLFATVSIFTGVMFLLLLHLYARLFWWRVEQHFNLNLIQSDDPGSTVIGRDHRRRRFVFAQAQEDPPRNTGLDSKILQSIHVVVYKSTDFKDGLECAVCLSDLVDGDKARVLPRCNHGFHVDCIDMWFQSHSTCPLCRNTVGSVEETAHGESSEDLEALSQTQNFEPGHSSNQHNPSQDQSRVFGSCSVRSACLIVTEDYPTGNFADSSNDHQQESTDTCDRAQEVTTVVVDIHADTNENFSERIGEEEPKSPMFTRLSSLKKFLSREKKGVVCIIGSSGTNNNNV